MSNPTEILLVLCTVPKIKSGESIGDKLVSEGLAACVNLVPGLSSIYRWKDEICCDDECLMLIKTNAGNYDALEKRIAELHPYELPEVIAVELSRGLAGYLEWVSAGGG